jgi:hypothetical protein
MLAQMIKRDRPHVRSLVAAAEDVQHQRGLG